MSTSDNLRAAKAIITDPAKWTKGEYMRDALGRSTRDKEQAVCFCALGAVQAACGRGWVESGPECQALKATMIPERHYSFVHNYNDAPSTTHDDVMSWFDRAIEKVEESK